MGQTQKAMGDDVSVFDSVKSLVTFSPSPRPLATKYTTQVYATDTYRGGADIQFGPDGIRAADWSGVNDPARLERAYRSCATAYACSTLLADAVAESPLRLYQNVDGEPVEVETHIARTVLANPNPYMAEAEFMSLVVMQMGLFGYSAIEKVRSAAGLPVQLWPLRPDWLRREKAYDGSTRWVLRVNNREPRVIADEDIILIPYRHDERMERVGVSPLHIINREVGIDVALTDLLKVFLDAGGIPPWAVEIPEANPDQAEVDLFREKWRQTYGGKQAYAQIGILHGGMKIHKVGDSIGDMAWSELRSGVELKIVQAYRVPADLVQARETLNSGSLTTTEMDGAMTFLQRHGATPLRQRIDGAFTRAFLPDFGLDSSYSVEFDTSAILSLQENTDALHTRIRADWESGLVTMAEARGMLGYDDLGDASQVFKTAFTTVLLPLGMLTDQPSTITQQTPAALPPPKMTPQYRDRKAMTALDLDIKANVLTSVARDMKALTQVLDRKMRQFWKAQGERIAADMRKSAGPLDRKDVLVEWDGELRKLAEVLNTFYGVAGEKAYGTAAAITGANGLSFDLANPNVQQMMRELGKRIVGIHETTRLDVSKAITTGLDEGLSPPQIADIITHLFEQTYKGRAQTVARTESQVAYNTASSLGYVESGVVQEVEMVDNPDHPEDYGASDGLTCAQRDGMVVNLADTGRHIEAEHPNGSLALIPLLSKPLGEV